MVDITRPSTVILIPRSDAIGVIAVSNTPRNRWMRYRYRASLIIADSDYMAFFREVIREASAEFLGVAILTGLGIGVNCQVVLSSNSQVASSPKGVSAVLRVYNVPRTESHDRTGLQLLLGGARPPLSQSGFPVEFPEAISILR